MKKLFILLLAGCHCLLIQAQTNTPAGEKSKQDVGISSHSFYTIGNPLRQIVYRGSVCVTNAQGKLTCEILTLNMAPEGSADTRPTNIVAQTNVIIDYVKDTVKTDFKYQVADGKTNRIPFLVTNSTPYHITCDKLVNDYSVVKAVTNDLFTLTGHVIVTDPGGLMTGEPLIYDNVTGATTGTDVHMIPNQSPGSSKSTNASPFDILKLK